jgi:hypothetical protein
MVCMLCGLKIKHISSVNCAHHLAESWLIIMDFHPEHVVCSTKVTVTAPSLGTSVLLQVTQIPTAIKEGHAGNVLIDGHQLMEQ